MRTPPGGLRPALLVLLSLALAAVTFGVPSPASPAARCNDRWPLKPGACGQRVKDLQWLLGSHRPNVFTEVKGTFRWKVNGSYGARTKSALFQYRFRIGYPAKGQCGAKTSMWQSIEVTGFLFNLLEGRAKRPACWVTLAAARLEAAKKAEPSAKAHKVIAYEQHLVALGIHETPDGSNRGAAISYAALGVPALQSATGAYGQAWCVSTQQTVMKALGFGTFADDTAGVYYAVDYYAARNLVFAKPKVGSLVAFITYDSRGRRVAGTGHMGFVTAVTSPTPKLPGTFTYIAGNDHNAVSQHTIPFGSRPYLFIRLPGIA